MRKLLFATSFVMGLSGCGSMMETQRVESTGTGVSGLGQFYMLPKALIPVKVVESATGFRVDIQDPIIVGDPDYQFALRYKPSSMSSDTIKVIVDSKTSLLKTLDLQTNDQTLDILKKIVVLGKTKSESAELDGTVVIFQGLLDPEALEGTKTMESKIKTALAGHISSMKAKCTAAKDKSSLCTSYSKLAHKKAGSDLFALQVAPVISGKKIAIATAVTAPERLNCAEGICHRGAIPYQVTVSLAGRESSTVLYLPNGGPILSMSLTRHPFVTTDHDLTIVNGMVTDYNVTKPSSALAAVSAPMDVYKAFIAATSEIFQLKIDMSKKTVDLETQRVAEATALADLKKKLDALAAQKQESGAITGAPRAGAILSVGVGEAQYIPINPQSGNGNIPVVTDGGAPLPAKPVEPKKQVEQGEPVESEQPGSDGSDVSPKMDTEHIPKKAGAVS